MRQAVTASLTETVTLIEVRSQSKTDLMWCPCYWNRCNCWVGAALRWLRVWNVVDRWKLKFYQMISKLRLIILFYIGKCRKNGMLEIMMLDRVTCVIQWLLPVDEVMAGVTSLIECQVEVLNYRYYHIQWSTVIQLYSLRVILIFQDLVIEGQSSPRIKPKVMKSDHALPFQVNNWQDWK